jgi:hypothetical protein
VTNSASSADSTGDDAIRAAQESKRRRREALVETIRKAGINPAEMEVTMLTSDDDQARLLQQMAERKEAHLMAEKFGREGLRARLKRTIEASSCNGVGPFSRNGVNGTHKPDAVSKAEEPSAQPKPDNQSKG